MQFFGKEIILSRSLTKCGQINACEKIKENQKIRKNYIKTKKEIARRNSSLSEIVLKSLKVEIFD